MSRPTTSLVAVAKQDTLRAVVAMRAAVPGIIAKAREEVVLEAMREERVGRWPFNRRLLTRAEAEHMVDTVTVNEMGFPHRYSWWRARSRSVTEFADHLEVGANLTQDGNLWLNLDDAHAVSTWL